jgi:hypothetical protein
VGQYSQFKGPLTKPGGKTKTSEQVKKSSRPVTSPKENLSAKPVEKLDDLESCERLLIRGFQDVARALARIREARLYTEAGYDSFAAYCEDRMGISRQRGDQFANAHFTIKSLPKKLATIVASEAKARAISLVSENKRAEVLTRIVESGEPVTAGGIKAAIKPEELKPRERKKPVVIDVQPEPKKASTVKHCPTCTCGELK